MRTHHLFITLLASSLFAPLAAQTSRVLPAGYDKLEGNSLYSYPFRIDGAIQVVYGRSQFGSSGVAILRGMAYRANAPFDAITGFKKKMKVTLYGTTTTPSAVTANPTSNIAGAKPTVAFDKELVLPNVAARTRAPAANFDLAIPFASTYLLDVTKHNLLTHVEPGDTTSLPSSKWSLDAVNHNSTKAFARKVKVGERCADPSGRYLSLTVSSASHNGSALGVTLKRSSATPVGTFPNAFIGLDFVVSRAAYPADLGPVGMKSCYLHIDPQYVFANRESASGTYAGLSISIPNDAKLIGIPYLVQALGLKNSGGFGGGVATDTYQVVNSGSTGAPPISQGIFYIARSAKWSMSGVGAYYPVTRFDGVFP